MKSEDSAVLITKLNPNQVKPVADLVASTINSLTYYNDRARAEETAKYGPTQLVECVQGDPDSVIVAYCGSCPVGFCISKYDDGLIWLSWFGVHKDYRRHGIGTDLLHALARTLASRRAHKVWCDTRTENIPSQRLLTKIGFVKIGSLANHWYGQDFFLWEWRP
jgi:ribosomal protein S18 acetylase RimI-like enzyme